MNGNSEIQVQLRVFEQGVDSDLAPEHQSLLAGGFHLVSKVRSQLQQAIGRKPPQRRSLAREERRTNGGTRETDLEFLWLDGQGAPLDYRRRNIYNGTWGRMDFVTSYDNRKDHECFESVERIDNSTGYTEVRTTILIDRAAGEVKIREESLKHSSRAGVL